jgi:nitrogen regulatory protein PII
MKLVCAVVKPYKLDQVLESLALLGIQSPTVTEANGYGQNGRTEIYRGAEFAVKFQPMVRIEVAVAAHEAEKVVRAIIRAAETGQPGDGKVFVTQLDEMWSISAGADVTVPPLAA